MTISYSYKDGSRAYWTIVASPCDEVIDGDYTDTVWKYSVRNSQVDFVYEGDPFWRGTIQGQGTMPPSPKDIVATVLSEISMTFVHSIHHWKSL